MFIKDAEFAHVKTSISNPQANGKTCLPVGKVENYHRTISEEYLSTKAPTNLAGFIIYIK